MSTWEDLQRLEGAPNTTYNDPTVDYSDPTYNYNGQAKEVWSDEVKH